MARGRPFAKGKSGNPGGRPKGSKPYAIRELVAEALSDPATWTSAILRLRDVLNNRKTVVQGLDFAARVNKEIGLGATGETAGVVPFVFITNVDPSKLKAARFRALPPNDPG